MTYLLYQLDGRMWRLMDKSDSYEELVAKEKGLGGTTSIRLNWGPYAPGDFPA